MSLEDAAKYEARLDAEQTCQGPCGTGRKARQTRAGGSLNGPRVELIEPPLSGLPKMPCTTYTTRTTGKLPGTGFFFGGRRSHLCNQQTLIFTRSEITCLTAPLEITRSMGHSL